MPIDENKPQVGDVGTAIEVEVMEDGSPVDISGGTHSITIQRPDHTNVTRAAVYTGDGSDGKINFITQAGDLSIEGTYKIQAAIDITSWVGKSKIKTFEVEENLE